MNYAYALGKGVTSCCQDPEHQNKAGNHDLENRSGNELHQIPLGHGR